MLNKNGQRELAYVVKVDDIKPIEGKDRVECAVVGGWNVMVPKNAFTPGDLGVYFEIDSKLDTSKPEFAFTEKYHGKIKTQKFALKDSDGNKIGVFFSQGLLMPFAELGLDNLSKGTFLTEKLGVTYADPDDNKRKSNKQNKDAKYQRMMNRNPKLAKSKFGKWCMKHTWSKKILFLFFGRTKDVDKGFPVGKFEGVSKTDQERVENMTWVLQDKTPYVVTQKCDGSSGTYILEKKGKNKFEFYVCSRNVRMMNENQESYYGTHNYYWEVAKKYDIESKMKRWLNEDSNLQFVCWQGEICAPGIQKNPHDLSETHFYCFHWTDNVNGRMDIRDAAKNWKDLNMEVVPIVDENYILPNDFEEFKKSADGFYDAICCEGKKNCLREGYVYYKTTDPKFSFKNVSREYLSKR